MGFDGVVTRAIVKELNKNLIGGKVNKINQPENKTIVLQIYNNRKNYKLLLDASSNKPRMLLSNIDRQNPLQAPNFCMLLRKHLQGGIVHSIEQLGLDRVVNINISSLNELGDSIIKTITIEVMGKYSNIILREKSNIIDSITRVNADISRVRQILPGLDYKYLEDDKVDITKEFKKPSEIIELSQKNLKMRRFFYMNYTGFSPELGEEVLFRSKIDGEKKSSDLSSEDLNRLDNSFSNISSDINLYNFNSGIYRTENGDILDFHCIKLNHLISDFIEKPSTSMAVEEYYKETFLSDKVSQKVSVLTKKVNNLLDKNQKKLVKLLEEKKTSENREKYKTYGDILSANIHSIDRGAKEIVLENFYDPNLKKISIPLDIKKSPWQNAQMYYKKYSKLKTSATLLKVQIPKIEEEIRYFSQVLDTLKKIETDSEAEEVKDELSKQGYIKKSRKKTKKVVSKKSTPLHFTNSRNKHFYVGKNNFQNDYITLKLANKEDIFIHVKDVPGSHVILRNDNISQEDILDGCYLAAKYSSISEEINISVDYTYKKNVNKPKGARPGMVYYEEFTTVVVNPKDFNYSTLTLIK
ncbi:NFACT RNA binding domain-containing protein [Lagierella sp.]|uniref:Rqc2 family fibronectin-binding protein n=1 Tax=Lagierella sp. TaxID=2849657 RepID=UPI0026157E4E|nr:NFACT RNA binding domain-containing protein [Lagierella sp.]